MKIHAFPARYVDVAEDQYVLVVSNEELEKLYDVVCNRQQSDSAGILSSIEETIRKVRYE